MSDRVELRMGEGLEFDEEGTVYAARTSTDNFPDGTDGARRVYHITTECRHYTETMREWDQDEAEEWGLEMCNRCSGGWTQGSPDQSVHNALKRKGEQRYPEKSNDN